MSRPNRRRGFRDLIFGDAFLGLWLVPMFLLVGLLGAGLAGVLVTLYFNQGDRTPEAEAAGEQENGEEPEDEGGEPDPGGFPYDRPGDAGVYRIRAQVPGEPSRAGSGFAVYSDEGESYLVTTYELVASDDSRRALDTVQVELPGGDVEATVHNYSRPQDLAIVVLRGHGRRLPVPDWRADVRMREGEPLFLVSVSGHASEPVLQGTVNRASSSVVVSSMEVDRFAVGGAFMDAAGQVVAVASNEYRSSSARGDGGVGVPIETLCQRLLECAVGDETTDSPGEATGVRPEGGAPGAGDPDSGGEVPSDE